MNAALLSMEDDDSAWITYEEYTLIKNRIDDAIEEDGLKLTIFRNNLYPDYYPLEFEIDEYLSREIIDTINGDSNVEQSDECSKFTAIYNALVNIEGTLFGSFYNYEYDNSKAVTVVDFYPQNLIIEDVKAESEYDIYINEDIDTYLRDLKRIDNNKPGIISLKSTNGKIAQRIQNSLQAYCLQNKIRIINYAEKLSDDADLEDELISIAKNDIGIENFESFRTIKFYKNPDINKDVIDLSQAQIIQEIIRQAEKAYDNSGFRDIFITASTGAGKSVMFQIPAVYLAKKHKKLTVIIEPVKALMQDQKEKLNKSGFMRVETFNSDLITQVEKEAVLQRIKSGEVDLLYLSPETLLSYSIETIVGDREIGLVIVDEAHIVTTWGVGFRPDYWYLGSYLNKLRNRIKVTAKKAMKQKIYHFPICAFTATAINGGVDDSISDTVISLYMENPIKYLGYVRRDEVAGGEEPEIFIRLNDPNKVKNIVTGNMFYSNSYVTKAKQKHDRDVAVLLYFFNDLKSDKERWDYIEDYFLGANVLEGAETIIEQKTIKMSRSIDKEHSYPTNIFKTWDDIKNMFEDSDHSVLAEMNKLGIPIPEYLETIIKKSDEGKDILMSWPSKDTLICQPETSNGTLEYFVRKGWHAYRIYEIDYENLRKELS